MQAKGVKAADQHELEGRLIHRFRELFSVDGSGVLRWRVDRPGGAKAGDVAGCDNGRGYLRTSIDGKQTLVHRIVWSIHHGRLPTMELDHVDRDPRNNRPENLREVTRSEQLRNRNYGRLGATGVQPNGSGFMAKIGFDKKSRYLGTYRTIEEASAAYSSARAEICFA